MKYTSFMCSAISIKRVVPYVIIHHFYFSFPAPDGPPKSFIVSAGARNVTFSWSPPAPTLRNGIITSYSLFCVPEGDGESTVSMQYTETGTFTLEGFAPATTYNCSISASNSEGSGPVANVVVATMENGKYHHPFWYT